VLRPGSVADIIQMVGFARAHRFTITPRGQGHSAYGQSQAAGGIIADMTALDTPPQLADGEITVGAGMTWRQVLRHTLRSGRPPVLTSYLGLSVGGTLSIGGLDGGSYAHGAQVDNLRRLEVVTGTGDLVTCSPDQHSDLLGAVLAGLGQCGIIVNATIPLVPADRCVREYQLFYRDLPGMLADACMMTAEARFDRVILFVLPAPGGGQVFSASAARFFTPPAFPSDQEALVGLSNITDQTATKDWPFFEFADRVRPPETPFNPWLDVILPADATAPFINVVASALRQGRPDSGDAPVIVLAALTSAALTQSLFQAPAEGNLFIISIQHSTNSQDAAARATKRNRDFQQLASDMGGAFYPYSALPATSADWRRHFRSNWPAFFAAKQQYDPDRVLTPGPQIFQDGPGQPETPFPL
jgi:cytokinin dehydrogenase